MPELIQHGKVVGERDFTVTDPEFEQITHDEQGVGVPRQPGEKFEKEPVVFIGFDSQVGICDKYLAHDGTIAEKQVKVKVEVRLPDFKDFLMDVTQDVEIVWEDLLEAFENTDPDLVYFLDRDTGEIFFVPVDYEDEAFWEELENNPEQFLEIPGLDYERERLLLREFIKGVMNENLRNMLERAFVGKRPYGRLDDILSFYPDEMERLAARKEELINDRVRRWLEEYDIFSH